MTSALLPATLVVGRVDVTQRALERVVTAIAAHELEVPLADVSVDLSDEAGSLGVAIVTPIRVAPLADLSASGYRMLDRAHEARSGIRVEVERQTGRAVGTIAVRFSKAIVRPTRRVR